MNILLSGLDHSCWAYSGLLTCKGRIFQKTEKKETHDIDKDKAPGLDREESVRIFLFSQPGISELCGSRMSDRTRLFVLQWL